MAHKPKPGAVFVVSQLQDGQWHELLVTTREDTARHGNKGRMEVPPPPRPS